MENIEKVWDSGRRSLRQSMNININMANWGMDEAFQRNTNSRSRASSRVDDDEEALRWAALEKLPTYNRLRTGILRSMVEDELGDHQERRGGRYEHKEVDVRKLDVGDRQEFIGRVFRVAEEDNERFLKKLRNRIDK